MKRIGIAASRMSKGNLWLYNMYVLLLSFLFSLFVFVLVGSTLTVALIIISYIASETMAFSFEDIWQGVFGMCMLMLTVLMVCFNILALLRNLKVQRRGRSKKL